MRSPSIPERSDCVDIERVLLLADSGVSLLNFGDFVLLVDLATVDRETLLLQVCPLLLRQLVEGSLWSAAELRREFLYFQLLLYLLILVSSCGHCKKTQLIISASW